MNTNTDFEKRGTRAVLQFSEDEVGYMQKQKLRVEAGIARMIGMVLKADLHVSLTSILDDLRNLYTCKSPGDIKEGSQK